MYFIHSKAPLFPKNLFSIQKVKNSKKKMLSIIQIKEFWIKVPTTDLAGTGVLQL